MLMWRSTYKNRLMTVPKSAENVQSGDFIWSPLMMGQPSAIIMDAIADRKDELHDIEYNATLTMRPYKILRPEYRRTFKLLSGFYSSSLLKEIAKSEWANYWPTQGSDPGLKYAHRKRVFNRRTGLVVQVAPPDSHGYVNLGLDAFQTEAIMEHCDWIIAQVNPMMPRTYGRTNFHVSHFTAFVEHEEPLITVPIPDATEVEIKMAEYVVSLLRDRDCLQIGIGAVPAMISRFLEHSGLKDLGVHSEMVPVGTHRLVEKGVVTCRYKKTHPGKIVSSFTLGDMDLYDFLSDNPMCEFYPTFYSNRPDVIAQEDNVVAINGSVSVDLTGQIASESVGNIMLSGAGGQLDFAIGAFWSQGGRAINLLPSTALGDTISRIVPSIGEETRVTVPRTYAGYVVTEYGIADLYGRTEPERAAALIKIAHPKFYDDLERGARKRGLIKKTIF